MAPAPKAESAPPAVPKAEEHGPKPAATKVSAPARRDDCTFAEMRVKVGDRALLEPPSQIGVGRMPVRIVGWIEGRSLIVTLPHTGDGHLTLLKDKKVTVRMFTGSTAFAFKATVLNASRPPTECLHLTYPDRFEGVAVRNSPRYRVNLPGKATADGGTAQEVQVENISATGALLDSAGLLGSTGARLKLDFGFELHGIPATLSLAATIRASKIVEVESGEARRHHYGIEFTDLAPNDLMVVRALVWYEMYEHPRNAV